MKAHITFSELSEYISRHYNQELTFGQVSHKTISVTYSKKILFKKVNIGVDITILDLTPETVGLKYDGGFGVDTIISGLLTFLKSKFPEFAGFIVPKDGHQLRVELAQFDKTKVLAEKFSSLNINICEDSIEMAASLK